MSAKPQYKPASRFGWQYSSAALVAVAILSSPFWGNAEAADNARAKSMDSMEMHKSMMSGMKGMESMKASGDTDHDFAMMMKLHHQNALAMANIELHQGKDPLLRNMAKAIIKSQTREIEEFDKWLAKHERPMDEPMSKSK